MHFLVYLHQLRVAMPLVAVQKHICERILVPPFLFDSLLAARRTSTSYASATVVAIPLTESLPKKKTQLGPDSTRRPPYETDLFTRGDGLPQRHSLLRRESHA
jgi:hypothetical protein